MADEENGNESDDEKGETSWKNSKAEQSENAGLPGDRPTPQSGLPEAQPSPEPEQDNVSQLTRAFPLAAIRFVPTKTKFGLNLTLNLNCKR